MGELLKAQYEAAGIQVDLVPQTGAAYEESWQSGQFDLLLSRTWGIPYEPYGSFFCMASPGDKFHLVQSGMSGKRELDVIMRDTLVQNDGERMKEDMAYIMESLHNEARICASDGGRKPGRIQGRTFRSGHGFCPGRPGDRGHGTSGAVEPWQWTEKWETAVRRVKYRRKRKGYESWREKMRRDG